MGLRELASGVISALEGKRIKPINLFEGEFKSGTVYMTNFNKDIVWNGNRYSAAGNFIGYEGYEETLAFESNKSTFKLSGILASVKALILEHNFVNNPSKVHVALLDENDNFIDEPFVIFEGKMSSMTLKDNFTSGLIEVLIPMVNQWGRFDERNGRKTNPSEQRKLYPGDAIFDQVPSLTDKKIYF